MSQDPTASYDQERPGVAGAIDRALSALDDAVPVEVSPANEVLEDPSRQMPWIGAIFAFASLLLVPWVGYIGLSLPARELSPNYDIAWAGFDVFLLVALGSAAYAVLRRSPWVGMSASAAAGLLVTDAWFDVITSPDSRGLLLGLTMATAVELPLAGVCVWLCVHAQDLANRRIGILARRTRRSQSS